MKLKSENQRNRVMNGNRCGDHILPDRYCTGSKNGYGTRQVNPFVLPVYRSGNIPPVQRISGQRSRKELVKMEIPDGAG